MLHELFVKLWSIIDVEICFWNDVCIVQKIAHCLQWIVCYSHFIEQSVDFFTHFSGFWSLKALSAMEQISWWLEVIRRKQIQSPFILLLLSLALFQPMNKTPIQHNNTTTTQKHDNTTTQKTQKTQKTQQRNNTTTQQHNNTITQQHNNTTTQQHNNTTTQQHNNTTTQQHNNTTTQQPYNTTTQQHNNITTQQHNNTTTQMQNKQQQWQSRMIILSHCPEHPRNYISSFFEWVVSDSSTTSSAIWASQHDPPNTKSSYSVHIFAIHDFDLLWLTWLLLSLLFWFFSWEFNDSCRLFHACYDDFHIFIFLFFVFLFFVFLFFVFCFLFFVFCFLFFVFCFCFLFFVFGFWFLVFGLWFLVFVFCFLFLSFLSFWVFEFLFFVFLFFVFCFFVFCFLFFAFCFLFFVFLQKLWISWVGKVWNNNKMRGLWNSSSV